jgi:hypothetical protein
MFLYLHKTLIFFYLYLCLHILIWPNKIEIELQENIINCSRLGHVLGPNSKDLTGPIWKPTTTSNLNGQSNILRNFHSINHDINDLWSTTSCSHTDLSVNIFTTFLKQTTTSTLTWRCSTLAIDFDHSRSIWHNRLSINCSDIF